MTTTKRRQTVRTALTRERIVAEGARLFNRRGFHGTSLDDIARALGVTKAALYYHVADKEDVLFVCYQTALGLALERIRDAMARYTAPDEQLHVALRDYIEGMTDRLRGAVALLDESALGGHRRRQILALRDEYETLVRGIIESGIASGVFVACDPKLVGFAILGAVNWIYRWYSPTGPSPAREIAETFSSYLVRGLQKRPSLEKGTP